MVTSLTGYQTLSSCFNQICDGGGEGDPIKHCRLKYKGEQYICGRMQGKVLTWVVCTYISKPTRACLMVDAATCKC